MLKISLLLATLLAAGCSSDDADAFETCGVGHRPETFTVEQCECVGGLVRSDPGDGGGGCDTGEEQVATVFGPFEGGYCCMPAD